MERCIEKKKYGRKRRTMHRKKCLHVQQETLVEVRKHKRKCEEVQGVRKKYVHKKIRKYICAKGRMFERTYGRKSVQKARKGK